MIIDISKWNGDIDFSKVKKQVDGIIIRIGYRGYGDGSIVPDPYADAYIKECIRLGIPYGVYFFSQAINKTEGKEEGEWTISQLKKYAVQPLLPVWIDTEAANGSGTGRADKITVNARTEAMKGFCEQVEKFGYWAGIYRSTSWYRSKLKDDELVKWSHWVADYRGYNGYTGNTALWQYSSGGEIDGIKGRVDLNEAFLDFPAIIKAKGLNGNTTPQKPSESDKPKDDNNTGKDENEPVGDLKPVSGDLTDEERNLIVKIIRLIIKALGLKI